MTKKRTLFPSANSLTLVLGDVVIDVDQASESCVDENGQSVLVANGVETAGKGGNLLVKREDDGRALLVNQIRLKMNNQCELGHSLQTDSSEAPKRPPKLNLYKLIANTPDLPNLSKETPPLL